jgi:hypothetical protein
MRDWPDYLSDRKRDLLDQCKTNVDRENALLAFYRSVGVEITEEEIGWALATYMASNRKHYKQGHRPTWRMVDNIGLGKFIGARS